MRDSKQEVLHFWFKETKPQQWFQKNDQFDEQIKERFESVYGLARDGLCDDWKRSPEGCVALCVVLDQFPRNMYRGTPDMFATDLKALLVAKHAIANGFEQLVKPEERRFLYLPYEHSENLADQKKSVELFEKMKNEDPLGHDYAVRHMDVIEKYGRFPHRNEILGRDSSPEEEEYLAQPGAGF